MRTVMELGGSGWRQWQQAVDKGGRQALLFLDAHKRSKADTTDPIRSKAKYFHRNQ